VKSLIGIKNEIKSDPRILARKIYLSYTTFVFENDEEIAFQIRNAIRNKFNIPFTCIKVCGSSQTGISFFKNRKFIKGESDLDVAIIDLNLFNKYSELSHQVTKGYSDLSSFSNTNGARHDTRFLSSLNRGFFNPFFMPQCKQKTEWHQFFTSLSNFYVDIFKNINAGIYASEYFFETKQEECINEYIKDQIKYDKISGTI
jgi:hypothetical protein